MYLSLFFDVEDCITPLSDDIVKDLAQILSAQGVVADLVVTGEKARVLERRGRQDVIEAMQRHAIGLHSNRHSRHPTVAEYLEHKGWEDGIAEAVEQEGPGVEAIQQIFGVAPECWGIPGGSWGPQIHPAMRHLHVPAVVYPETFTPSSDVHWYCGVLTFGYRRFFEGFDFTYSDDGQFQTKFEQFQAEVEANLAAGFEWMGVFCAHPVTVRALEFGDAINFGRGKEVRPEQWEQPPLKSEAEYRTALQNFSALVAYVAAHPRLQVAPVRKLMEHFGQTPTHITKDDLVAYAKKAAGQADIPVDEVAMSPAEAVDAMTRYLLAAARGERPAQVGWRYVEGPVRRPPEIRTEIPISGAHLLELCTRVQASIDETQRLPAGLEIECPPTRAGGRPVRVQIGIGSLFAALCDAVSAQAGAEPLPNVILRPVAQLPSIAADIAQRVERGYWGWVIHKLDLHTANLVEFTRLQTWTLRRAAFTGPSR